MDPTLQTLIPQPPKWQRVTGRVISGLLVPLFLSGVVMTLMKHPDAVKGMREHGYPDELAIPIVVVELVCLVLYIIPQTAVLGAILLTGYLGGAVATHVRVKEWDFLMAVIVGVLAWLALYLREPRLRALVPLRRTHV
jgi:hypothetical protein